MAKVLLDPIGTPREQLLDARAWETQRTHHAEARRALEAKRAEVRAGWGEKYQARVREDFLSGWTAPPG